MEERQWNITQPHRFSVQEYGVRVRAVEQWQDVGIQSSCLCVDLCLSDITRKNVNILYLSRDIWHVFLENITTGTLFIACVLVDGEKKLYFRSYGD